MKIKKESTFIPKLECNNTLEYKLLNKILYPKLYIRSYLLNNKKVLTLDNNINFFNIKTDEYKNICNNSSNFLGKSFTAKEFTYLNNKSKNLAFTSFITNDKLDSRVDFFNALKNFKPNFIRSLVILNPVKGGFTCYSAGFIAFMPFKQYLSIFFYLRSNALINKKANNPKNFFSFLLKRKNSDFFSFRLPYFLGSLKVYSPFIRNNFSSKKTHRKKLQKNLNFVFTLKTIKKEN